MPKGDDDLNLDFEELLADRFLFGSPDEIAEQIIGYKKRLGVTHMVLGLHWVGMPHNQVTDSMNLFAEEVMPRVEQGL
jgi:alkanesulfonate monooxygenase SsuD/methylene tetrahydromethanopterin reductase-like flavin-dependent oxidoreductase (luciferase family)